VIQWVEVGNCTATYRSNKVRRPPETSTTIRQRLHLRRHGRLPTSPATIYHIILPRRFFILHRYDNLPSSSTTIYYIISTATILHPYSRSPPTSTKTCNVLFFTTILHLPPEQKTYSNDKDFLPSLPRRFNGLLLIGS